MSRPWQVGDIVRREWPNVSTGGKTWIETGMVTLVDETGGLRTLSIGPIKYGRSQEWLEEQGWKLVEGEMTNG